MSAHFLDLRPTGDPARWILPVGPANCVGPAGNTFLFGGAGLAAAIDALERSSGRPVAWATVQYLAPARPGATLEVETLIPPAGRGTVQARAVGRLGDVEVFEAMAAPGGRADAPRHQWSQAPRVPLPEACPPTDWGIPQAPGNMFERLDIRAASDWAGRDSGVNTSDGAARLWLRTREDMAVDAPVLAIFADFLAAGVGVASGGRLAGVSLDNTLRILALPASPWVLGEIQIHGLGAGFAHGEMRLFAQTGGLLAVASQTMVVRTSSSFTGG